MVKEPVKRCVYPAITLACLDGKLIVGHGVTPYSRAPPTIMLMVAE